MVHFRLKRRARIAAALWLGLLAVGCKGKPRSGPSPERASEPVHAALGRDTHAGPDSGPPPLDQTLRTALGDGVRIAEERLGSAREPTTEQLASGSTSSVAGEILGIRHSFPHAYARLGKAGRSLSVFLTEQGIPVECYRCSRLDTPWVGCASGPALEEYSFVELDVPSGPAADFFAGRWVPAKIGSVLPRDPEFWEGGEGDASVVIDRLDTAGLSVEGRVLVRRERGTNRANLEGRFTAPLCFLGDSTSGPEASVPPPPDAPFTWKAGNETYRAISAFAQREGDPAAPQAEDRDTASWVLTFLAWPATCEDFESVIYDSNRRADGFVVWFTSLQDGTFATDHAVPGVGAKVLMRRSALGLDSSAPPELWLPMTDVVLQVTDLGSGESGNVLGAVSFAGRACPAESLGHCEKEIEVSGGGRWEAEICPRDLQTGEAPLDDEDRPKDDGEQPAEEAVP